MSDAAIAFFMAESETPVCGFFLPVQLERFNKTKAALPVAMGISALLLTNATSASGNPVTGTDIQRYQSIEDNYDVKASSVPISDTFRLKGIVKSDSAQQEPIIYASVIIKGRQIGTTTDKHGAFHLTYVLPADIDTFAVIVTVVGFERKEFVFNRAGAGDIDMGEILLRESAAIVYRVETVRYRHPLRRFWKKITRPLRKH
ncbi:carboxypeptidase-like regulatory domain-containing protein [Chitinophaga pinensis]|nr:carboxypeptidase-like regulatory domain-containing protein [Chitinophaga pinensis]